MVDPATILTIIATLTTLYEVADRLGQRYGPQIKELYSEYRSRGVDVLRNPKAYDILRGASSYAAYNAGKEAPNLYATYKNFLKLYPPAKTTSSQNPTKTRLSLNPRVATALAALIFLGFLGLTYFSIFPSKTTVHVIVPITTNLFGLVFSFIILFIGIFLVLRKEKITKS